MRVRGDERERGRRSERDGERLEEVVRETGREC